MREMGEWFRKRRLRESGNACLVVQGPSGVGKSTAVELSAHEHGFHVEHTYANVPRTPQKLQSIVRKLTMHSGPTVLVLDDFESFIFETTSVRDVVGFARSVTDEEKRGMASTTNQTLVIVCNEMDKSFQPLFNVSTVIEFENPCAADVQKVLRRIANSVSGFAYIPPMDIFFIAHGSTGNIAQTINQMQFSHGNNAPPKKKGPRPKKMFCAKSQIDCALRNWSTTHRSTSIDCFAKTKTSVTDYIWAMSKGFHMDVRENLHKDYPLYFHNSTCKTLHSMWEVAQEVSACDTAAPDEEDALYGTENRDLWGRDNTLAVAHISAGISCIQGRKRTHSPIKKRKVRKPFGYC